MDNTSGLAGKALFVNDPTTFSTLLFLLETSEVKILLLGPGAHSVFISTAGETDFLVAKTRDNDGAYGVFGADAVYSGQDGNLFLGDFENVSALRITAVKTALSAADDEELIEAMGGRVFVRAVAKAAVTLNEDAAGVLGAAALEVDTIPANTAAPAITGLPNIGEELTVSDGTWTGVPDPVFTYQWLADDVEIVGETESTYIVAEAEDVVITAEVTATNAAGAITEASDPVTVLPALAPPVNTVLPAITGTPNSGEVLSVSDGTWTGYPVPTYTYAWEADDVPIGGEVANTYTVAVANGVFITAVVTATNTEGVVPAESAAVEIVAP
jgi:hypothetical protein